MIGQFKPSSGAGIPSPAARKEEHFLFIGAGDESGVSRKASLRAGDQKMVWTEPLARPWLWALHGGPRICSVAGWAQEGRMGLC